MFIIILPHIGTNVTVGIFMTLTCNTGSENDLDHTSIIRQHYVFLVDNMDAKHCGLVSELFQAEVLSIEEIESITSEVISFAQNVRLLSILSRKSQDQFDKFLDALDKSGQQDVRNHLTGREGLYILLIGLFLAVGVRLSNAIY